jgi:LmbE family N-acetylglucosaminyl deacetylase
VRHMQIDSLVGRVGANAMLSSLRGLARTQNALAFQQSLGLSPSSGARANRCRMEDVRARARGAQEVTVAALTGGGPVVVLAPHADDEALGCGGLIAACARNQIEVHVVVVTDGTGSHFTVSAASRRKLQQVRQDEAIRALGILGLRPQSCTFLAQKDGALLFSRRAQRNVTTTLRDIVRDRRAVTLFATWALDPHPDHVAVALIAASVNQQVPALAVVSYPVWGLMLPPTLRIPCDKLELVKLDVGAHRQEKSLALQAYRSQLAKVEHDARPGGQMRANLVETHSSDHELYFRRKSAL